MFHLSYELQCMALREQYLSQWYSAHLRMESTFPRIPFLPSESVQSRWTEPTANRILLSCYIFKYYEINKHVSFSL